MAPPDCWANGAPIRCFKCRKVLGNQNWYLCNVAPDAASGGTMMPFHRECAPIVFHGPTLGPSAAELAALRKDAERYRWLHNGDVDGLLIMKGHVDDREDIAGLVDGEELDRMVDEAMNRVIETTERK